MTTTKRVKLLLETVLLMLAYMKSVSIHSKAVGEHVSTLNTVRERLEGYNKQYNDAEYMATLSMPEKRNLINNANTHYQTYQELTKELDYLDMSKHPLYLASAIVELEKAALLSEFLYDFLADPLEGIVPKLKAIRAKSFPTDDYKHQIEQLYYEIESFNHDYYNPTTYRNLVMDTIPEDMINRIYIHITLATMYMQKEKERMETEAIPDIKSIPLPVETVPELPAEPIETIEAPAAPETLETKS